MKRSAIKNHIVTTASRLFYEQGYNSTGVNEIIAEAGIAKATLYNHFKSKDDICIAFLQQKNHKFIQSITEFCNAKPKGNNRILAIFDFLLDFYRGDYFNGCWCINTMAEIPKNNVEIIKEIRTQKEGLLHFISETILQNKNNSNKKDASILAKQLYILYEGAVAESYLQEKEWPIIEAKNISAQLIN